MRKPVFALLAILLASPATHAAEKDYYTLPQDVEVEAPVGKDSLAIPYSFQTCRAFAMLQVGMARQAMLMPKEGYGIENSLAGLRSSIVEGWYKAGECQRYPRLTYWLEGELVSIAQEKLTEILGKEAMAPFTPSPPTP